MIRRVLLCGLGAVGLTYANKLKETCELKVLADSARIKKYTECIPKLNGEKIFLNYITPSENWNPDLIIITTKYHGLESAIEYIENFINKDTIIFSLINGISSENKIAEKYGRDKVLHSYFIGHSAVREGSNVIQDGVGKIVFGSPYQENKIKVERLEKFLKQSKVDYEIPKDIIYSLWLKFTLNIFSNQSSAIMNLTFGEMKTAAFKEFAKKVINEVSSIAEKEGIQGFENLENDAFNALDMMIDCGKTSMLQDILAQRKTEVEIFSGEIIKLGKKYSIPTPYNQVMFDMIRVLEGIKR